MIYWECVSAGMHVRSLGAELFRAFIANKANSCLLLTINTIMLC